MQRRLLRAALLTSLVVITVPLLAILCRGRVPSRYDAVNLPLWERQIPDEAPTKVQFPFACPSPEFVKINNPALQSLLNTDEDKLTAELSRSVLPTLAPDQASRIGVWLLGAAGYGRTNTQLNNKMDRVAIALMSAQQDNGFLGVQPTGDVWTVSETAANCSRLTGLIAYYHLTKNPSAIYTAMKTGNLILWELGQGHSSPSTPQESLVAGPPAMPCGHGYAVRALALLYLETGEKRYLDFAIQHVHDAHTDGLALCALYEATGGVNYLKRARRIWEDNRWECRPNATELTATLFELTGSANYASEMAMDRNSPWAQRMAVTNAPGGLAINTSTALQASVNSIQIEQHCQSDGSRTIEVLSTERKSKKLRILVDDSNSGKIGPPSMVGIFVDGKKLTACGVPGAYITLDKQWKQGDVIEIKPEG